MYETPDDTVKKKLATQPATNLATQPENNPHQPWRAGSTRWGGGHLHQNWAIDGVPPQIGFPPHQTLPLHYPISQNNGLEAQNRLEATSHQKLVTDGASPKLAHTTTFVPNHHELGQSTWAGSIHHLEARAYRGGGGGVYMCNFTVSHKILAELGWKLILTVSIYYFNL